MTGRKLLSENRQHLSDSVGASMAEEREPSSPCRVRGCMVPAGSGRVFCAAHWQQLPGKTRSSLSFTVRMRRTPAGEQAIDRAAALLERAPQ